jgi:16S rRNA G527 N7-methylase RsmG
MTEASRKKAEFLSDLVRDVGLSNVDVLHAHVQRPGDLHEPGPFDFLTCRAMGNWERVLPRFAPALSPDGFVLLWAGPEVDEIGKRAVWKRYRRVAARALPGPDRGFLYEFAREPGPAGR